MNFSDVDLDLSTLQKVALNPISGGDLLKQAKKSSGKKARYWGTIIYPDNENLRPDYIDIIKQSGVPCIISPIHDLDVDQDGVIKKPHYHAVFVYENQKSFAQMQDFFNSWGGVGAEVIQQISSYIPYLWHGNDKDKAQYNPDDCMCLNGFKISKYVRDADYKIFKRLSFFAKQNHVMSFSRFLDELVIAIEDEQGDIVEDDFTFVIRNAYAFVSYFKTLNNTYLLKRRKELEREILKIKHSLADLNDDSTDFIPTDLDFEQLTMDFIDDKN